MAGNTNKNLLQFPNGFKVTAPVPIDVRLVLTKAEMKRAHLDFSMPDAYFCFCPEDKRLYAYHRNNPESPVTGRFRLAESALQEAFDAEVARSAAKDNELSAAVADAVRRINEEVVARQAEDARLEAKIDNLTPVVPNPVEPTPSMPKLSTVGIKDVDYRIDAGLSGGTGIKIENSVVSIDPNTAYVNKIEGATDTYLHQWAFVTQSQWDELERTHTWMPGVYYTITDDTSFDDFVAAVTDQLQAFNAALESFEDVYLRDTDVIDELSPDSTKPVQSKTLYYALHHLDLTGITDKELSAISENPIANKTVYENLYTPLQQLASQVAGKQNALTAGSGISINGNVISSYNTLHAGQGIDISNDTISAYLPLQAGEGIDITNNTITNTAIVTIDSTVNSISTNPVQNRVLYNYINDVIVGNTVLTLSTDPAPQGSPVAHTLSINDSVWSLTSLIDQTVTKYGENPVAGSGIYSYVAEEIAKNAITVDASLSADSENPVQNKAIANVLNSNSLDIELSSDYVPGAYNLASITIGEDTWNVHDGGDAMTAEIELSSDELPGAETLKSIKVNETSWNMPVGLPALPADQTKSYELRFSAGTLAWVEITT